MDTESSKVFIIDDDEGIRRSLTLLLSSAGYSVDSFSGADEFFQSEHDPCPACILLDIFLDGESGLDMQEEIKSRYASIPIIYITGSGDIPMSVQAMRKGAINFLQKPIDDRQLIGAVEEALHKSRNLIRENLKSVHLRSLVNTLTPREFDVFRFIIKGLLNKQIAVKLDITEHTVKIHRGKITEKLGVRSAAEMVRMAEKLNIE